MNSLNEEAQLSIELKEMELAQMKFLDAEEMKPLYYRNNRTSGQKNLRCFPTCGPSHSESTFCGRRLRTALLIPRTTNITFDDVIVVGEFRPLEEGNNIDSYDLIDLKVTTISEETLFQSIKTKSDSFNQFYLGKEVSRYDSMNSGEFKELFLDFNEDCYSWHYGWKGNRYKQNMKHAFIVSVLLRLPGLSRQSSLKIIGQFTSPDFCVMSLRRRVLPSGNSSTTATTFNNHIAITNITTATNIQSSKNSRDSNNNSNNNTKDTSTHSSTEISSFENPIQVKPLQTFLASSNLDTTYNNHIYNEESEHSNVRPNQSSHNSFQNNTFSESGFIRPYSKPILPTPPPPFTLFRPMRSRSDLIISSIEKMTSTTTSEKLLNGSSYETTSDYHYKKRRVEEDITDLTTSYGLNDVIIYPKSNVDKSMPTDAISRYTWTTASTTYSLND